MTPDSREQMIAGAVDLLRRRGLGATSVRELAKHSGAPLGSTYHHFPGGKQELAAEAVRSAGRRIARVIERKFAEDPVQGLRAFAAAWRQTVLDSDFRAGCPVLAVAVEEPDQEAAAQAAAAGAFTSWQELLAAALGRHGARRRHAEQVATLVIAALEGSVAMCRAQRSTEPLERVARQLEPIVAQAVGR